MTAWAVVSVTEKVTTPDDDDVPLADPMLDEPPPWDNVTVLPATGLLLASSKVTVIVELDEPFAVTDVGLADTVEWLAETDPAVKVTAAE